MWRHWCSRFFDDFFVVVRRFVSKLFAFEMIWDARTTKTHRKTNFAVITREHLIESPWATSSPLLVASSFAFLSCFVSFSVFSLFPFKTLIIELSHHFAYLKNRFTRLLCRSIEQNDFCVRAMRIITSSDETATKIVVQKWRNKRNYWFSAQWEELHFIFCLVDAEIR